MSEQRLRELHCPRGPFRGFAGLELAGLTLTQAQASGTPVRVVLFWGVHPRRTEPGKAERRTLSAFIELFHELLGVPCKLFVILADEHGRFNGIHEPSPYLDGIARLIDENPHAEYVWLSELYARFGLTRDVEPDEEIHELLADETLRTALLRGAANRGQGEDHAWRYAMLRRREVKMIRELVGSDGLFLVVGGPEYQPLFQGVEPVMFANAKAKSGAGWVPQAPWIEQQ